MRRLVTNLPLHDLSFSMTKWQNGIRVSISPHAFWPDGGSSTVCPFPSAAAELADGANGCFRTFDGAKEQITMVWVVFDSPLTDGDGDGPYAEGEIEATELSLLD